VRKEPQASAPAHCMAKAILRILSTARGKRLKDRIRHLYEGEGAGPSAFRWSIFAFDLATIAYFLWTATEEITTQVLIVDGVLGLVIAADWLARIWIARDKPRFLADYRNIADVIVIASLAAPLFFENLAFIRILRALRFLRSFRTAKELRKLWPWFARNEHVVTAATNLVAFVFVVTSVVWVLEHKINDQINTWVDALYFTVTTLTTTGFGDIILKDVVGRLLTVGIMVFGVALFLRLVQQIFRPHKIEYRCRHCGLTRHDPDASHCKHCGNVVYIETEGEG
jgi:voltage-gated potassium channel